MKYLALLALAILLVPTTAQGSESPSAAPWGIAVQANVPLGQSVYLVITGPAGGYFSLNFTAAPFNHSYPIFEYGFHLPVHYGQNVSTVNLTIPTLDFGLGAYQVALWNNSTPIVFSVFHMTDPVNGSELQQNISNLQAVIGSQSGQIQGLATQLSYLQFLLDLSVGVFVSGMIFVCLYTWHRARKEANKSTLRNVTRYWERMTRVPGLHQFNREFGDLESTPPNPERVYRSGYCELCKTALFTRVEIALHLTNVHGIKDPTLNRDYYADPDEVSRIEDYRKKQVVRTIPKPMKKERRRSLTVSLEED